VPVAHLGGWYDIFLNGTIKNYLGIQARGGGGARGNQKLVIGPWIHGPKNVGAVQVGALTFPGADLVQYNEIRLPWFDHWLKGMHTSAVDEPSVLIYVMGDNAWRAEHEWPLARTRYTKFYFHGGTSGSIASLNDGTLSTAAPRGAESPDTFRYDPLDPIPTLGGNTLFIPSGPQDHRDADARSLTYSSEPLPADLEVTGPITAVLHAMSSAVDTDWVVRLTDVYPDGRSINIADGILRARYRESRTTPTLIEPGTLYEYTIDLWATSTVFKAGHRLRVSVHSSSFPRWDRNLNTAESPEVGARTEVALNTIFHDELRPSHIVLPVIPR
jgi:putative CocE/NonD family hydrolase